MGRQYGCRGDAVRRFANPPQVPQARRADMPSTSNTARECLRHRTARAVPLSFLEVEFDWPLIDPFGTLTWMNPHKVDRARLKQLTDLPNVGKATAADLRLLGIHTPEQLARECPLELYDRLCRATGHRHDPCVMDVLMSITEFMRGQPPRPWWEFTEIRKRILAERDGGSSRP